MGEFLVRKKDCKMALIYAANLAMRLCSIYVLQVQLLEAVQCPDSLSMTRLFLRPEWNLGVKALRDRKPKPSALPDNIS